MAIIFEISQQPYIFENEILNTFSIHYWIWFLKGKGSFHVQRHQGKYRKERMAHSHEVAETLQCSLSVCTIPNISWDLSSVTSEHTQWAPLAYLFPHLWAHLFSYLASLRAVALTYFIHSFIHSLRNYSTECLLYIRHCSMQRGYFSKQNRQNDLISRNVCFSKEVRDNKPINK